jgi:microcystin-dependent protein
MRKQFMYAIAVLAGSGLLLTAPAQPPVQAGTMPGCMGIMQGRMGAARGFRGQAVMQNALARDTMTVFLLPDLQAELALTPAQTAQLSNLKTQFIDQQQKNSADMIAARNHLNSVVSSGTATDAQVRSAIAGITNLQGQRMLNAYQTATQMKAALSPQQRARLQAMTPAELRSAAMSHLTMDQMAQMMQVTRATAGPMMPAGMMAPGMMGAGMRAGVGPGMAQCPCMTAPAAPQPGE